MVFGFCGTGTLACAVGKEQVIIRTPFSPAARCSLIPLSSLSEPAGAGPEFARVGEPRASRKDDSGDIFHADSVRSRLNAAVAFATDHTNYFVTTHYFDPASATENLITHTCGIHEPHVTGHEFYSCRPRRYFVRASAPALSKVEERPFRAVKRIFA